MVFTIIDLVKIHTSDQALFVSSIYFNMSPNKLPLYASMCKKTAYKLSSEIVDYYMVLIRGLFILGKMSGFAGSHYVNSHLDRQRFPANM